MNRRHRVGAVLLAAFALLVGMLSAPVMHATANAADTAPIAKGVQKKLADKGSADYWVVFEARADLREAAKIKDWNKRGQVVVDALKTTATKSQANAKKLLKGKQSTAFWAANRVFVRGGDLALTKKLAALPEVARITAPQKMAYDPPKKGEVQKRVNAVEWGIAAIKADQVWSEFGVRGEGITVANIDTGVQYDHPALVGAYRGNTAGTFDHNYNFYDPEKVCGDPTTAPCDLHGHGSHTMGTMVGDDGAGNQIGVAPGAKWIAAVGCDPAGGCSDFALISSGQWMLEPRDLNDQNPDVSKRPNIVNNSWGAANGGAEDPFYDEVVAAWNASGIFGTFSNGNEGPECDSTGSPADSADAYGVGAFDVNSRIASFSSRGPGAGDDIRPHISAPGVDVRSSVPGNGFASFNGTSMAAPHLSGTAALVMSAAPATVGQVADVRALLDEAAVDVDDTSCGGTAADNNVWGEGKLDALASVTNAPRGDTGFLEGTVTRADNSDPIPGARIALTGPVNRTVTTGVDGAYKVRLPVGTYQLNVGAFGFRSAESSAEVKKDETTTHNVQLTASPAHPVSGQVTDARGDPVEGAVVKVEGTPIAPATTDADGRYSFASVPEGTYSITADAGGCTSRADREVEVAGELTVNFELVDKTDEFGYHCVAGAADYVEGDTPIELSGDDASAAVELPFAFWLYGESYNTVNVSTNGHVSFKAPAFDFDNTPIPTGAAPNAAIYALWDDLIVDSETQVNTRESGSAPNRTFTIEWRNVAFLDDVSKRVDAEITLHENGRVALAYRGIDPASALERGGSATVGIENAQGNDALQYAVNSPVLSDERSITFSFPPSGVIAGTVTDKNDGLPVAGAKISVNEGEKVVREVATDAAGKYKLQVPVGDYTVSATAHGYVSPKPSVKVEEGRTVTRDLLLRTARAELDADDMTWVLPAGVKQEKRMFLGNTGSAALTWEATESGGRRVATPHLTAQSKPQAKKADPNAKTAAGRYTKAAAAGAKPMAPGDVLASWATELTAPWGVGHTGRLWISDPETVNNTEFSLAGAKSGRAWPATWAGVWNGDMSYDTRRGDMCQVNVGGDNGIYCWKPDTGEVSYKITGSPWGGVSQRGLAYREDDDSFYIAGWNEDIVYHVKGASADKPGEVIGQCSAPAGAAIAGLAWNPDYGVLWATINSPTSPILRLNAETCELQGQVGFPDTANEYAGAGIELDSKGDLWVTSQADRKAYLVESGLPLTTDVPWLKVSPAKGRVAIGDEVPIAVSVDTTGLEPGVYRATITVRSNAGRQPNVEVPVQLTVAGYWNGVDVGATSGSDDKAGLPWVADREYRAGRYGWVGTSTVKTAPDKVDIRGTEDDALYRSQREGMEAYRFDRLPAGKYEVTLDYAELARSPRVDWRMFDVSVNGQYVQVAYDIAAAVGGQRADRKSFIVDLSGGGDLTVDFHPRRSYRSPVVNAVRVVHRPDLR